MGGAGARAISCAQRKPRRANQAQEQRRMKLKIDNKRFQVIWQDVALLCHGRGRSRGLRCVALRSSSVGSDAVRWGEGVAFVQVTDRCLGLLYK